jgi:hypothetical protein
VTLKQEVVAWQAAQCYRLCVDWRFTTGDTPHQAEGPIQQFKAGGLLARVGIHKHEITDTGSSGDGTHEPAQLGPRCTRTVICAAAGGAGRQLNQIMLRRLARNQQSSKLFCNADTSPSALSQVRGLPQPPSHSPDNLRGQ